MRILISGGGMAGLVLARGVQHRGGEVAIIERASPDRAHPGADHAAVPGVRRARRDRRARPDPRVRASTSRPTATGGPCRSRWRGRRWSEILREGLEILWEHELVDLLRDGDRVVGARLRTPDGERDHPADLVVGADGTGSRVRELAGIPADLRVADTAFVSFRSPVHAPEPFSIAFLSDGRQVTLLDWAGGSAGGWQIDRVPGGAEEALAPGIDAFREAYLRLLPQGADVARAAHRRRPLVPRGHGGALRGVVAPGRRADRRGPPRHEPGGRHRLRARDGRRAGAGDRDRRRTRTTRTPRAARTSTGAAPPSRPTWRSAAPRRRSTPPAGRPSTSGGRRPDPLARGHAGASPGARPKTISVTRAARKPSSDRAVDGRIGGLRGGDWGRPRRYGPPLTESSRGRMHRPGPTG